MKYIRPSISASIAVLVPLRFIRPKTRRREKYAHRPKQIIGSGQKKWDWRKRGRNEIRNGSQKNVIKKDHGKGGGTRHIFQLSLLIFTV